jgi:hypothetical protein
MKSSRPAFLFYPGDWFKNTGLRACSLAARGVWADLLCFMDQGPHRGYLCTESWVPYTDEQLARMCGCFADEFAGLLLELLSRGIGARSDSGILHSPRMVKDVHISDVRSSAGRAGAVVTNSTTYKHVAANLQQPAAICRDSAAANVPANTSATVEDEYEYEDEVSVFVAKKETVAESGKENVYRNREPGDSIHADDARDRFLIFSQFLWTSYPAPGRSRKQLCEGLWRSRIDEPKYKALSPDLLVERISVGLEKWKRSNTWLTGHVHSLQNFIKEELWDEEPPPDPVRASTKQQRDVQDIAELHRRFETERQQPTHTGGQK